jgi:hypothetical protein
MAHNEENQPPEHEAQPEPPASEPTIAQPQQADDEPQGAAVEPAPKTPRRAWWRFWRRRERTRSESHVSVLTALISALAALAGAGVGGIASYKAAQSQDAAQFRVAQANNTAQADQALITRKQIAYSDYLAADFDMENSEFRFQDALFAFKPPNVDGVKAAVEPTFDSNVKYLRAMYNVELVDSPEVDQVIREISSKHDDLTYTMQGLMNAALTGNPVPRSAVAQIGEKAVGMKDLRHKFRDAARKDISGLSGH